jgi:regulator of sirC expression with transglutaminase-like and TPR domain
VAPAGAPDGGRPGQRGGVSVIDELARAATGPADTLARAALLIGRLEYPDLDPCPYLARLDEIGREAARRVQAAGGVGEAGRGRARVEALNTLLFADLGFHGNRDHYDDPRNSFFHDVLDRRTGIPITLSLLYMEVGRRAGLTVQGLNVPGHFLVREAACRAAGPAEALLIDPFNGGRLLSEPECHHLVPGLEADDQLIERSLRTPATARQVLVRMLRNLKRVYVRMRSFPQARAVTDLILALDPSALVELRDRGLLSFQLKEFGAALRDLETYLHSPFAGIPDAAADEQMARVRDHVVVVRKRLAELN